MESQFSDNVVHVERRTTWTHRVLASLGARDHDVSDEEIYALLNADSDDESAAHLCAARGVTLPTYCVWKTKYQHLTIDEVRRVRRRELWRARCLLAALLTGAVVTTGSLALVVVSGLGRAAQANVARAAEPAPQPAARVNTESTPVERIQSGAPRLDTAPAPASSVEVKSAPAAASSPDTPGGPSDATTVEPGTPAAATAPSTEPVYTVQVAAAATLQEARVLVERLAAAGYPAYLSRAIVSDVEVFRVRIGPFDTPAAAKEVAVQIRRDGYNSAWIAR